MVYPSFRNYMDNYLAIDIGITNFATCVSSFGLRPFILDGKIIKNINYNWKKQKEYYLSILSKQHIKSSKKIEKIDRARINKINNILNKYTKYIIDYCKQYSINYIIVGNINDNSNIKNDFNSFVKKLKRKSKENNIVFIIQDEAYTSKSSFIDNDILPERVSDYDWSDNFSGERITRGLYQTKENILINADVNGAYNILRKYNQNFNIEKLDTDGLKPPIRIRL